MNNKDRAILLSTLLLIAIFITTDLISDSGDGVVWWHLLAEGAAGLLALGGVFYLLIDMFKLRQDLNKAYDDEVKLKREAEEWRQQAKTYIDGLSTMIACQLTAWNLSPAECEVTFLLLKGMSMKSIAQLRGTSEKTARVQAMAIYAKAGLTSRSELSAYFLEDLLPAQPQHPG